MVTEQQPRVLGVVLAGVPAGGGVTAGIYASRGYDVVVADLDDTANVDRGLQSVRSAMDVLAGRATTAKIAVVGYGAGGRYAFLAVTRLGADAAAAFYGADIVPHLGEAVSARKPLTFHFGDADERVPFADVRAIKGALEGFATTEIYRYPGAPAGFALREDPAYDETPALQAERRVFAVLDGLV
jgi:carboxymethylenebutenolidase